MKYKHDIAEPGMEPNTHMFANNIVDRLNAGGKQASADNGNPNGSAAGWFSKGRKDISDKDIDEEVHGFSSADTNVLPYAWDRPKEAPKANPHYVHEEEKKEEKEEKKEEKEAPKSFAQFDANTENIKVSFLDPGYYQHLARENKNYRGNELTTFYA